MKHIFFLTIFFIAGIGFSQQTTTDTIIKRLDVNENKHIHHKPFVDKIENGESFQINWSSHGCFHSVAEKMTISKKNDRYSVQVGKVKKTLTKEGINSIRKFEKELNKIGSFGCTTVDNYTLVFNKKEVKVDDGSCDWNGFYKLKKALGIKTE